jgi:ACS family hexuronate transporter-like MFS transporter
MQQAVGKYRWTICALIFFATTINYLDRSVISLLKTNLEKDFQWNESDYADIVIAFQLFYAIGLLIAGWVIDTAGSKIGYAISIFVWSVAAIGHALVKSTWGFIFARGALGVSEAGNFPAAIKTVAEWFPKRERALATGIFNSGAAVGAITRTAFSAIHCSKMGLAMGFYNYRVNRIYLAIILVSSIRNSCKAETPWQGRV